ncbi:hypothetical protein ACRAWF_13060 [Streptomyces sp. L7]
MVARRLAALPRYRSLRTHLDPADLALLKNTDVLAVRPGRHRREAGLLRTRTRRCFAKTEPDGDVVVGLFNTGSAPREVATTASALGLAKAGDYFPAGSVEQA